MRIKTRQSGSARKINIPLTVRQQYGGTAIINRIMRRVLLILPLLLITCSTLHLTTPDVMRTSLNQETSETASAVEFIPTSTPLLPPSPAPTTGPTAESRPTSQTDWLEFQALPPRQDFEVYYLPAGALVAGDLISFQVLPPDNFLSQNRYQEHSVIVSLGGTSGTRLGEAAFAPFGLGGRIQATFLWTWDTTGLPAGEYNLTFSVEPDGSVWNETVMLLPRGQLPPAERTARWASTESDCCLVHYITHTAVERDLPDLLKMIDQKASEASQSLGVVLSEPVVVTLLPRVVGHGGFAASQITLSYLDRNYAGGSAEIIFEHELIHILDGRLGGKLRPPFLVEGLAVYLSGGHFKPELLLPRAAALLPPEPGCTPAAALENSHQTPDLREACGLDLYIPMHDLVFDFYRQQHETGYLESGALVQFMVDRWGWKAFSAFYRDIHLEGNPEDSLAVYTAIESALGRHFGSTLGQLEVMFIQALQAETVQPEWVEDVQLTLEHHDRVRAYQQQYDPSAYFLNAWLPDTERMRKLGIVADVMRSPATLQNLTLELLLTDADRELRNGSYAEARQLLETATLILRAEPKDRQKVIESDTLATDYFALIESVVQQGYQPARLEIKNDQARIWVSASGQKIVEITYSKIDGKWLSVTPQGNS